jgi:hypothetical protein
MGVQKTVPRSGRTLEHGSFKARESVHVCLAGCRQPSGSKVTRRAACLCDSLPPGQTVGYDVMVFAGLQRSLITASAKRFARRCAASTASTSLPAR